MKIGGGPLAGRPTLSVSPGQPEGAVRGGDALKLMNCCFVREERRLKIFFFFFFLFNLGKGNRKPKSKA